MHFRKGTKMPKINVNLKTGVWLTKVYCQNSFFTIITCHSLKEITISKQVWNNFTIWKKILIGTWIVIKSTTYNQKELKNKGVIKDLQTNKLELTESNSVLLITI